MKIMVVFGTRPELIKLAPVILELRKHPERFRTYLLATAQHRRLLDQMLSLFAIAPDRDLDLMTRDQSLEDLAAGVLTRAAEVYGKVRPDLVLVQGDTTTAMAAALAAFYRKIPVAHVEAGLRSGDPGDPFPEEINRRIISSLAAFHFAPTRGSVQNLRKEGVAAAAICLSGNTVVDALRNIDGLGQKAKVRLPAFGKSRLILVTTHRRENFGAPLAGICRALVRIAERFPDVEVAYPVHPNPNVRRIVRPLLSGRKRIHLLAPQDYPGLLRLLKESHLVMTDSGGIQEEAPTYGKPVLVLRRKTERPEGIAAGIALLVGTETEAIVAAAEALLLDPNAYRAMVADKNPYGDGHAAERIVSFLARKFAD